MQQLIQQLALAFSEHGKLPAMPENLTLEQAYHLQKNLIRELANNNLAGYKAGVTTLASQQYFGLTQSLLGGLYTQGRLASGCRIAAKPGLLLECEIGIVVDQNGVAKSAGPAIEVVYMDWLQESDLTASNIAAANLGADRFIVGPQHPWCDDYSDIRFTMSRNGEPINAPLTRADVMQSMGGPKQGLNWMLGEIQRRQLKLQDNMLLMTGTCGGAIAATVGDYKVDYGDLGCVEFSVY